MQTYDYSDIEYAGSVYFNTVGVWSYINSTYVNSTPSYNNNYTSASLTLAPVGNIRQASLTVTGRYLYSNYGTLNSGILTIPEFGTIRLSGLDLYVYEFNNYDFSDLEGRLPERVIGSQYDDYYYGYGDSDKLYGNSGNDNLHGGSGNDLLVGGSGNDTLIGGSGKDSMIGGDGNDIYIVENVNDTITENFAEGTDLIQASTDWTLGDNCENLILTGSENINGTGNNSANTIKGNNGANRLNGGLGNDRLVGGAGIDTAVFSSRNNRINLASTGSQNTRDGRDILQSIENVDGGAGNDIIIGNNSANKLNGDAGDDRLFGGIGNDRLNGGDDNDRLFGEAGKDLLIGGDGNDILNGGDDNDRLFGEVGKDLLKGGSGNDRLNGDAGDDRLFGGIGNDRLNGGDDNDRLFGDIGNDRLNGGAGNDRLNGGDDNDRLFGKAGNDVLIGGAGNDVLDGGGGRDTLNGGEGNNILIGGHSNKDIFCINTGLGRDLITDYSVDADEIKLLGGLKERNLTINQAGFHVRIKYEDDLLAIVTDTIASDLTFI